MNQHIIDTMYKGVGMGIIGIVILVGIGSIALGCIVYLDWRDKRNQ